MRLDGVSKRYGFRQPWVVRDISLEIAPGRLVRLEGKNGAGKSTLLRVIAGVAEPTKGTVTGRPITGYVPERFPPALPFSARDYLSHLGRVHGLDEDELPGRVEACLERLGGTEFADVQLRTMSKGMCQKVAVAQALLPRTGLLVLDEAWTGLDTGARAALDSVVAERLDRGGSVVFVDHDPLRLAQLEAERWCIDGGQAVRVTDARRPAQPAETERPAQATGRGRHARHASGSADQVAGSVVIGVTGYPADDLTGLPGVRTAESDGERALIQVEPGESDAVLRKLLAAGESVHVYHVGRESSDRQAAGSGSETEQAREDHGDRA